MSTRTQLICIVVLTALVLAAWRFKSSRAAGLQPVTPQPAAEAVSVSARTTQSGVVESNRSPVVGARTDSEQSPSATARPPVPELTTLNERTLAGTKWGRNGFSLEFGQNGKLLIGGRERAQWRVDGSRIRLYRDTTGEEHWLDIVGNKLMWEGQEVSRVQ